MSVGKLGMLFEQSQLQTEHATPMRLVPDIGRPPVFKLFMTIKQVSVGFNLIETYNSPISPLNKKKLTSVYVLSSFPSCVVKACYLPRYSSYT